MARPKLGKGHIRIINGHIDSLFDRLLKRVLGGDFGGKEIRFKVKKPLTIPGLFDTASREEGHKPDQSVLDPVLHIAKGYLDAQRERTKAKVVHTLQSAIDDAWDSGKDLDVEDQLRHELIDVFGEAKSNVKRIINTEANTAKNTGILDSIIKVNAQNNIDDPTVAWLCVHDNDLCEECRNLHLLENGTTPRVWYLSECGHGYHKPGEDAPKIGGLHPNDRCTIITVLPGYGFNENGKITWIAPNHSEIEHQRRKESPQPELSV